MIGICNLKFKINFCLTYCFQFCSGSVPFRPSSVQVRNGPERQKTAPERQSQPQWDKILLQYTSSIPNLLMHPQENSCHIHNIEAILKVDIHSESLGNNLQLCFGAIVDQTHRIFSIQLGASTLFWEENLCSQKHSF